MQPINKTERSRAFWNFLLLFMLSIAILLTMGFFGAQVPLRESKELRSKMELIDKERNTDLELSIKFTKKMINISRMLDTINRTSPQDAEILEGKISEEIAKLNSMVPEDTLINNKELYLNVVHNLGDMQQYLKEIRKKGDKDNDLTNLKTLLQKAQDRAQEYSDKYYECLAKK